MLHDMSAYLYLIIERMRRREWGWDGGRKIYWEWGWLGAGLHYTVTCTTSGKLTVQIERQRAQCNRCSASSEAACNANSKQQQILVIHHAYRPTVRGLLVYIPMLHGSCMPCMFNLQECPQAGIQEWTWFQIFTRVNKTITLYEQLTS